MINYDRWPWNGSLASGDVLSTSHLSTVRRTEVSQADGGRLRSNRIEGFVVAAQHGAAVAIWKR